MIRTARRSGSGTWAVMLGAAMSAAAGPGIALNAADDSAVDPKTAFVANEFTSAGGKTLPYRLLAPLEVDPQATYPLVLFLHGAGERGRDNAKQLVHGMRDFANGAMRRRHPCYVVAPQCPDGEQWVNVPWSDDAHEMPAEPSSALALTLELLDSLERQLPIDAKRRYVTGLSMGGFGSWDLLQRHPDRFAAAVIVCGGGDANLASKVASIPVWMIHGDQDGVVKVRRSRDMVRALSAANGRPVYTEIAGAGHDVWTQTFGNRAHWDWLMSQRRP